MKKIALYIKLNILYMFRNKARISLTLMGICIGLFIYTMGNVVVGSYIDSLYKDAYMFDENSFWIYDRSGQIVEQIYENSANLSIGKCNFSGEAYSTYNDDYTYKGIEVKNSINLIGLDYGVTEMPIPFEGTNDILLLEGKILYGEDFSKRDIENGENYIVIEKSTALFLFQKENAVGEYLDVVSPYGYDRFKIVGIIDDLPATYVNNLTFNRMVKQKTTSEYNNILSAYTTYGYLEKMLEKDVFQERCIVDANQVDEENKIEELIEVLNKTAIKYNIDSRIVSQNTLIEDIKAVELTISTFVNMLIIVIILISGFMIVTIYVFSVKERMYEIGVRRAIGASRFDIVSQFMTEGIIVAFLASVITLFVCVISCNLITSFLIGVLYWDISLVISKELIFSMFGLSILQGIAFCLIPASIASQIKPTEAIRWD